MVLSEEVVELFIVKMFFFFFVTRLPTGLSSAKLIIIKRFLKFSNLKRLGSFPPVVGQKSFENCCKLLLSCSTDCNWNNRMEEVQMCQF